jgi:hypothetical protein
MAEDDWIYYRTSYKDGTEVVIRVSRRVGDLIARGVAVATVWADYPDEIAVTKDGKILEQYDPESQGITGVAFLEPEELGPKGPPPSLGPLIGFDETGTEAWLVLKGVRYLDRTPTEPYSDGLLIVHNQVSPAEELGVRGFRAWLASHEGDGVEFPVEPCACGWAPEAGTHYRVRSEA